MKRVTRNITASHAMPVHTSVYFTPEDVVQLLLQVEELQNCRVALMKSADGSQEFLIGNSVYSPFNEKEGVMDV